MGTSCSVSCGAVGTLPQQPLRASEVDRELETFLQEARDALSAIDNLDSTIETIATSPSDEEKEKMGRELEQNLFDAILRFQKVESIVRKAEKAQKAHPNQSEQKVLKMCEESAEKAKTLSKHIEQVWENVGFGRGQGIRNVKKNFLDASSKFLRITDTSNMSSAFASAVDSVVKAIESAVNDLSTLLDEVATKLEEYLQQARDVFTSIDKLESELGRVTCSNIEEKQRVISELGTYLTATQSKFQKVNKVMKEIENLDSKKSEAVVKEICEESAERAEALSRRVGEVLKNTNTASKAEIDKLHSIFLEARDRFLHALNENNSFEAFKAAVEFLQDVIRNTRESLESWIEAVKSLEICLQEGIKAFRSLDNYVSNPPSTGDDTKMVEHLGNCLSTAISGFQSVKNIMKKMQTLDSHCTQDTALQICNESAKRAVDLSSYVDVLLTNIKVGMKTEVTEAKSIIREASKRFQSATGGSDVFVDFKDAVDYEVRAIESAIKTLSSQFQRILDIRKMASDIGSYVSPVVGDALATASEVVTRGVDWLTAKFK